MTCTSREESIVCKTVSNVRTSSTILSTAEWSSFLIVIGLRSKAAYYNCTEKGSALRLEETIEIAQNQDATVRRVGYMREAKAIHYKWKFINSKETGSQEPSGPCSSMRRKGITVLCADQRVKMHVSVKNKCSLQQFSSAWNAYWMNTSLFTSTHLFITSQQ